MFELLFFLVCSCDELKDLEAGLFDFRRESMFL